LMTVRRLNFIPVKSYFKLFTPFSIVDCTLFEDVLLKKRSLDKCFCTNMKQIFCIWPATDEFSHCVLSNAENATSLLNRKIKFVFRCNLRNCHTHSTHKIILLSKLSNIIENLIVNFLPFPHQLGRLAVVRLMRFTTSQCESSVFCCPELDISPPFCYTVSKAYFYG